MLIRLARLVCAVAFVVLFPLSAFAQTGAISGLVTDSTTHAPLAGANVIVEGTALLSATDPAGRSTLFGVPAGSREILVSYLGHRDERAAVEVASDRTQVLDVQMARTSFEETVVVTASSGAIAEGQAQALNQQRTAPNITNVVAADQIGSFPDPNAAEAISRIPGASIARDQGEGRYVLIRGTEPRLNSMMIDGERIPAPEGELRQVALDAIPADQLQSIEVSKAVTPDMDADSIGGAVNLVTKQAVSKPTMLFSLGGGYNALQRDYGQRSFSGTVGRRFNGSRLGLLAGFSASQLNKGSENFEATYAAGALSDLQLRDYQIKRERYGFNFSADARTHTTGNFSVRTIFNEFKDYEVNNRLRFRPPNRRLEHVLKNRHQHDAVRSISAGGAELLGGRTTLDYRFSWARSVEDQPDRLDTIFRQTNVNFTPNVSADSIDPTNIQPNPSKNTPATATLNAWEPEIFKSTDRDVTGQINLQTQLGTSSSRATVVKVGLKVKDKSKTNDFLTQTGTPTSPVLFPTLEDTGFDNSRFLDFFPADYPKFPGINP